VLYGIHALLAGAAYWVAIELGIHHSTTFSHGLIDYLVLYPHAQRGWWLVPLGLLWAGMYYVIFRTLILKFDLKTPGRESDDDVQSAAARADAGGPALTDSMAAKLVAAFGGESNIRSLDACITRLRMELVDNARANPDALRALGASGVMVVPGGMQAVFGTRSENLKTDMEEYMRSSGAAVSTAATAPVPATPAARASHAPLTPELRARARAIIAALGGAKNIVHAELLALTRLRVELRNADHISDADLTKAGALGAWRVSPDIVHVIVGEDAPELADSVAESRSDLGATATLAK
jgi:PTS system glucose-specific IIC component